VGIVYTAAAFLVVPGLLFIFDRLSRPHPRGGSTSVPSSATGHAYFVEPPASVADEAERWLQSRS
jgi:hypothetical protein